MMHKAGHGKYSVNTLLTYLFSTPWANILRAYDRYEIVSHNSPVASSYSNLVGLSVLSTLLTHSCCSAFFMLCPHLGMPFPKSLPLQFLPIFQNQAEVPPSMELLVPISSPKRPILSLSVRCTWTEAPIWALDHSMPQPSGGLLASCV